MNPRVSIITVSLNSGSGLEETVNSILSQNYSNIDLILIDGGSTDGSLNFLKEKSIKPWFFTSEKDTGVYNAMNKGLARAAGEFVLFLNAGDYFYNESSVLSLVEASQGVDLIYGDIVFKSDQGDTRRNYPDRLTFSFFLGNSLPHPCTLIRKTLFDSIGSYDETFKICADWAFFLDALAIFRCKYRHICVPISVFRRGGLSSDVAKVNAEKWGYLTENYAFFYQDNVGKAGAKNGSIVRKIYARIRQILKRGL